MGYFLFETKHKIFKLAVLCILLIVGISANAQYQAVTDFGDVPVGQSVSHLVWFYLGAPPPAPGPVFLDMQLDPTSSSDWTFNYSCSGTDCLIFMTFTPTQAGPSAGTGTGTLYLRAWTTPDGTHVPEVMDVQYFGAMGNGIGGPPPFDLELTTAGPASTPVTAETATEIDVVVSEIVTDPTLTGSVEVTLDTASHHYTSSVDLPTLAANGFVVVPFMVTYSATDVGQQTIVAKVNPSETISETSYGNNSFSADISVEPAVTPPGSLVLTLSADKTSVYPKHESEGGGPAHKAKLRAQLTSTDPKANLNGQVIWFSSEPVDGSGGHNHSSDFRPVGTFQETFCLTDQNGKCSVVYVSSEVSGTETITASVSSSPAVNAKLLISIRVPGLVQMPPDNLVFNFTGKTNSHPNNHFLKPAATVLTHSIASAFYDKFGARLDLNDMSLETGGLFDIGPSETYPDFEFWHKPHSLHRVGLSVDVGLCAQSAVTNNKYPKGKCANGKIAVSKSELKTLCNQYGGHLIQEEPNHCEFYP